MSSHWSYIQLVMLYNAVEKVMPMTGCNPAFKSPHQNNWVSVAEEYNRQRIEHEEKTGVACKPREASGCYERWGKRPCPQTQNTGNLRANPPREARLHSLYDRWCELKGKLSLALKSRDVGVKSSSVGAQVVAQVRARNESETKRLKKQQRAEGGGDAGGEGGSAAKRPREGATGAAAAAAAAQAGDALAGPTRRNLGPKAPKIWLPKSGRKNENSRFTIPARPAHIYSLNQHCDLMSGVSGSTTWCSERLPRAPGGGSCDDGASGAFTSVDSRRF